MAIPFVCSPTVTGNSQQYVTEVGQDVAGVRQNGTRVGQDVTRVGNQAFVNRSSPSPEEHIQIIKQQEKLKYEQCAVILSMAEAKISGLEEGQRNIEAKISRLKKLLPDLQTKNDKNVKTQCINSANNRIGYNQQTPLPFT